MCHIKPKRHSKAGLTPERQKENLRKTKCIYSSYLLWNWQRLLLLRWRGRSVQPVLRGSAPLLIWQWKIALPPMYSRGRHTDTIGQWRQTKTTERKDVDDISALRNVLTSHCVVLKKRKGTKKKQRCYNFSRCSRSCSVMLFDRHTLLKNTALLLREQTVFTIKADEIDPSFFLCFSFGRPWIWLCSCNATVSN